MQDINFNIKNNFDKRISEIINNLYTIYENNKLKISYLNNDDNNKNILIIFSYAQKNNRENIFFYLKKNFNIIYIVDKKNSWFNNFSPIFIKNKILNLIENKSVYILGQSMGGFQSIIFSNYINCTSCISICPQYTLQEKNTFFYRAIKDFDNFLEKKNIHTVFFNKKTNYIIVFSNDKEDSEQFNMFSTIKDNFNFKFIILKGFKHETVLENLNKNIAIHYYIEYFIKRKNFNNIKSSSIFKDVDVECI